MRKMMQKVTGNVKKTARKAVMLMKDTRGENYVDTAVKILIAVVLGALLLAGLYALFGDGNAYPYPENSGNVQLRRLIGGNEDAQNNKSE